MITWDEFPKVELDFMNEDHKDCVESLGVLQKLLSNAKTDSSLMKEIDKSLGDLELHLKEHFQREEQAMEETGFPPYYVHKTEHESVLQQLQQAVKNWQDDRNIDQIERFITVSFVNWLETHAITMDTVTAQFVARNS